MGHEQRGSTLCYQEKGMLHENADQKLSEKSLIENSRLIKLRVQFFEYQFCAVHASDKLLWEKLPFRNERVCQTNFNLL